MTWYLINIIFDNIIKNNYTWYVIHIVINIMRKIIHNLNVYINNLLIASVKYFLTNCVWSYFYV